MNWAPWLHRQWSLSGGKITANMDYIVMISQTKYDWCFPSSGSSSQDLSPGLCSVSWIHYQLSNRTRILGRRVYIRLADLPDPESNQYPLGWWILSWATRERLLDLNYVELMSQDIIKFCFRNSNTQTQPEQDWKQKKLAMGIYLGLKEARISPWKAWVLFNKVVAGQGWTALYAKDSTPARKPVQNELGLNVKARNKAVRGKYMMNTTLSCLTSAARFSATGSY